ncbi:hypothetical protein FRC20_005481, partial [Serendipita sp. 405]
MYSMLLRLLVVGLSVQSSLGAVAAAAATSNSTSIKATSSSSTIKSSSSSIKATSSSSTIRSSSSSIIATSTVTSATSQPTFNQSDPVLDGTRTEDVLADIKGIYGLPGQEEVIKNATLNATDIQGDI